MQPAGAFIDLIGLPSFVLTLASDGTLLFDNCNRQWCELTGVTKEDLIGRPIAELPGPAIGPFGADIDFAKLDHGARIDLTIALGGTPTPFTLTADRHGPDASARFLVMQAQPIAAHPTHAAAQALTEEMERFISFAAHDLRTPMRNIESLAELLREDFVDMGDGKLELIDMLEEVATKATRLITDILAQAQASEPVQPDASVDFVTLCDDIMGVLDPSGVHQVVVATARITVDKAALQIALRNLLDNALKHAQAERVVISITVTEDTPGMLRFVVRDNGGGFDDPSIAFLDGGALRVDSGYGLLGVRRLITDRGGQISAENLPGGTGSMVRFSLPGRFAPQG